MEVPDTLPLCELVSESDPVSRRGEGSFEFFLPAEAIRPAVAETRSRNPFHTTTKVQL